ICRHQGTNSSVSRTRSADWPVLKPWRSTATNSSRVRTDRRASTSMLRTWSQSRSGVSRISRSTAAGVTRATTSTLRLNAAKALPFGRRFATYESLLCHQSCVIVAPSLGHTGFSAPGAGLRQHVENPAVDAVELELVQGGVVVPAGRHAVALAVVPHEPRHHRKDTRLRTAFVRHLPPIPGVGGPGIDAHQRQVLHTRHQRAQLV